MSDRHKRAGINGFTLLEVAVSVSVIVIGVLALCGVMVSVSKQREELHARSRAAQEAQSIMEIMKAGNPDTVATVYDGKSYSVKCKGSHGTCTGHGEAFTVHTAVDPTNDKLPMLTVTVSWNERGVEESLVYSTERYTPNGSTGTSEPALDEEITWDPDVDGEIPEEPIEEPPVI